MEDLYKYEKALYKKGLTLIGGVDEVGRGLKISNQKDLLILKNYPRKKEMLFMKLSKIKLLLQVQEQQMKRKQIK